MEVTVRVINSWQAKGGAVKRVGKPKKPEELPLPWTRLASLRAYGAPVGSQN